MVPTCASQGARASPTVPWTGRRWHAGKREGLRVQREEPRTVEKHQEFCLRSGPAAPAEADEIYDMWGSLTSRSEFTATVLSNRVEKSQLRVGIFTYALIFCFNVVSSALPSSPGHAAASGGKSLDPAARGNLDSRQSSPTALGSNEAKWGLQTEPGRTGGDSFFIIISMFPRGEIRRMTVFQGTGNNNPTHIYHICYFHLRNCEVGNALVLIHL